jgi:arachidonate 5-lipoxygenase
LSTALSFLKLNIGGSRRALNAQPFNPAVFQFPDVDLSWMMKKMDGAPPPEYFFDATKIKRLIKRVAKLTVGLKLTQNRVNRASAERVFEEFFTDITPLVPKPKRLIKHWDNDKELARQMLCGVNPVMIMVTKDLSQLSDNIATHFGERKLQGLIDEKRLFFVSYDDIAELEVNPHQGKPAPMNPTPQDDPRPFYAPIAIFALDETRKELDIMGIQLERTDDAKVYTKADGNEWLFAKIHLSSTDSNIHEWVSHLGKTHLTMEPHILAIHNTLKMKDHKVYTFLAPLCKDTLFLNCKCNVLTFFEIHSIAIIHFHHKFITKGAARKTLAGFSAGAFGDEQSSIGVGQFMQINRNWWSTYNFFESSGLPSELASRGFDKDFDMPPYLFREDGMQLWDAYGEFAADFVNEIYKSDAEVNEDDDIQAWAKETSAFDKAAVPGFPATIKDKVTLVNILQTLMWIPSGLHAAVNFPQYDFYAYAPNKPLAMRALLPASNCEDIFKNALPTVANAQQIITTTTILTLPSQDCIDNLQNNFSTIGNKSYTKFQSKLDEIGDGIERRNKESKKAGNAVYSYLNPSVVPASIDI